MELFYNIIWWLNIIFIILVGSGFLFQLLFMFLFYLKPRQYKKAQKYHDFTIIIRAHNEEDVIRDSVTSALKCDYPAQKRRVIVFCHNCTDRTAEIARECGARTVEFSDSNPKHRKGSYCFKYGMDELKKEPEGTYEYFLFIDADNQLDRNYILECNNAADEGVLLGRTYENSKNLTDNLISCMSGLWYIRDNLFACRSRSHLGMGCVMDGCSAMVKAEYALNWDAMSSSEDLEFTLKRLLNDGIIVDYIENAMVYEDQPASLRDMFNRNTRMGNGLNKLFWKDGFSCLKMFFKTFFRKDVKVSLKMSYLDHFTNLAIIPLSFFALIWFSFYYIYALVYTGLGNTMNIYGLGEFGFTWFLLFVIIVGLACFLMPFFFQPLVSIIAERKKLVIKNKAVAVFSILLYPCYIFLDAISIFQGILMKPKWKKIKRSKTKIEQ